MVCRQVILSMDRWAPGFLRETNVGAQVGLHWLASVPGCLMVRVFLGNGIIWDQWSVVISRDGAMRSLHGVYL